MMMQDLAAMPAASRRLVLACYAHAHPTDAAAPAVWARLQAHDWVPTLEDCPVRWEVLRVWYDGLARLHVCHVEFGA